MARIGKLLRVQRAIRSIRLVSHPLGFCSGSGTPPYPPPLAQVRIMRLLKIEKFSDALTQAATLAILLIVCLQPVNVAYADM